MRKIAILSLIAAISIFTSCEKDPVLGVSVKEISAPFSGNETSVVITANNPWVVQGNEWCVVDPDSGEAGEFTVTLKVKPNETYDPRECDVKVSSSVLTEVIKVTQVAQSVIQSEATEFSLSGEEQTFTFSIQSNTDVQVSVSDEWIQFKEIKGLESNNLIFNVQENQTKSQREAEITIKNNEGDVSTKISVRQNALRAYLPEGPAFNQKVNAFMTEEKGIIKIEFITGSTTTSEDELVEKCVYLVKNNETLEIHTPANQFVANNDCSLMFTGYKYEDNTHYIGVCNSFSNIESIDFGDNFNTQNVTDMSDMFSGCSALTSLDVAKFNTENVTSMFSMFSGCSALASLDVRNFDTKNVWTMYCMFELCRSLTSLDVTNFNTKKVSDMTRLFGGCSGLTSLDVANFNTENVTGMDGMFKNCINLTSLDITNFNTENVTNMTSMFNGCKGLVSLDLSNFNTGNVTYMNYMFSDCSSLTSLNLSSFSFTETPYVDHMFANAGKDAINKPISIYVTLEAKQYLVGRGTCIDPAYAKLVVEGEN